MRDPVAEQNRVAATLAAIQMQMRSLPDRYAKLASAFCSNASRQEMEVKFIIAKTNLHTQFEQLEVEGVRFVRVANQMFKNEGVYPNLGRWRNKCLQQLVYDVLRRCQTQDLINKLGNECGKPEIMNRVAYVEARVRNTTWKWPAVH